MNAAEDNRHMYGFTPEPDEDEINLGDLLGVLIESA